MLEIFDGRSYYYFLDGYSDYIQVSIAPEDREKTTLPILFALMLLDVCLLAYVMHLLLFRDA